VTAKNIVFFPAPALCATEAAYQQNCNSRGDHQRQEASARDEPVNETMHMDSGRTIEPYLLRCKSKLRRTTYGLFDSTEDGNGGEAIATIAPNRNAQELSDLAQSREGREAFGNSGPHHPASKVSERG